MNRNQTHRKDNKTLVILVVVVAVVVAAAAAAVPKRPTRNSNGQMSDRRNRLDKIGHNRSHY